MKRKGNLYQEICKIENIISAFREVCRNTKNKKKVEKFKAFQCVQVSRIYDILINKSYVVGPYHKFVIYEPKKRHVVSQNLEDKVINHLVARHILMPAIFPGLIDSNVASRKGLGTARGLSYFYHYNEICKKKYEQYYVLKCDIQNFFHSIDHEILKKKILRRIKDKDAIKIVFDLIDSEEEGLGIGNMTSQILAIFYLDDLDKFIKEKLKIKYYVRYQDDFCLWHPSKEYLRHCLKEISKFLVTDGLMFNRKTRIFSSKENFIYLGRGKDGRYAKRREIRRKLKKREYLYKSGRIPLNSFVSSIRNYRYYSGI